MDIRATVLPEWKGTDITEAVVHLLATPDAVGRTPAEIAADLHLPDDVALQDDLEALVARGILERQGVGHGALYSVALPIRVSPLN